MNILDNIVNSLFDKILSFPAESIELRASIGDNRLDIFEKKIGLTLPLDYKYMLKKHNGFSVMGTEVNGLDNELRGSSLDEVYYFEHNSNPRLPHYFLPISYDGRGNFYCLDLSKIENGESPVLFWQSDYNYAMTENVEITNANFLDWVNEVMIEWNK